MKLKLGFSIFFFVDLKYIWCCPDVRDVILSLCVHLNPEMPMDMTQNRFLKGTTPALNYSEYNV